MVAGGLLENDFNYCVDFIEYKQLIYLNTNPNASKHAWFQSSNGADRNDDSMPPDRDSEEMLSPLRF